MYNELLRDIIDGKEVRGRLLSIKEKLTDLAEVAHLKGEELYSLQVFLDLLKSEDAKTRKNTALILGMFYEPDCVESLMRAYETETTMFVKATYLKALSSYDYSPFEEILLSRKQQLEAGEFDEKDVKHIALELSALKEMYPDKHNSHVFQDPSEPVKVIFTTRKEIVEVLVDEIDLIDKNSHTTRMQLGVSTRTKSISAMAGIRIYKEMLFPLNALKALEKPTLAKSLIQGDLYEYLKLLHVDATSPFRFRLTSQKVDVSKISRELETLSKGALINSPSDYEIELKLLENKEGKVLAFLKLHTLRDRRFAYRRTVISSSMNPVNAASMVRLVKDYLIGDAQILDPFCGTGAVLIERNYQQHASHIYGIDTFSKAIDGARENARSAKMDINFINRNYFDFKHEYLFDEIITDMPRLLKGEADEFYGMFFEKSETILKKDGLIILYSNEKGLVKKYLRLSSAFKLVREFAFHEKEGYSVFVIVKQTGEN